MPFLQSTASIQCCHKCHTSCDRPSWQPPLTVVTLLVTLPPGVTRHCTDLQELGLAAKQEGLRRRLVPFLCSTALTWVAKLGYFTIFLAMILKKSLLGKWKILKNISISFIHYCTYGFYLNLVQFVVSSGTSSHGPIPQMHPDPHTLLGLQSAPAADAHLNFHQSCSVDSLFGDHLITEM